MYTLLATTQLSHFYTNLSWCKIDNVKTTFKNEFQSSEDRNSALRPVHNSRESKCEAKFVTSIDTMVHGKYSRRRFAKVEHISTCANNVKFASHSLSYAPGFRMKKNKQYECIVTLTFVNDIMQTNFHSLVYILTIKIKLPKCLIKDIRTNSWKLPYKRLSVWISILTIIPLCQAATEQRESPRFDAQHRLYNALGIKNVVYGTLIAVITQSAGCNLLFLFYYIYIYIYILYIYIYIYISTMIFQVRDVSVTPYGYKKRSCSRWKSSYFKV